MSLRRRPPPPPSTVLRAKVVSYALRALGARVVSYALEEYKDL
jgi:hypothetical protein